MGAESCQRVLVAGATGYLGRHLVAELQARGVAVRALVRRPEQAAGFPDCETFVGQATRPTSLRGLCDGIDVVVSSLGTRSFGRGASVWEVDEQANLNVLAEAHRAGVRHFLFVSVLHGARLRHRVQQVEARERVVDALKTSAPAWTVLRPTAFFNDMEEFFRMAQRGPVWLVGPGHNLVNPIHGRDLAACIADAIEQKRYGEEIPVGGPSVFTYEGVAEAACDALGRPLQTRSLPAGLLRLLGAAAQPINVNFSSFCRFFSLLGTMDAVAPAYGHRELRAHFAAMAAQESDR